MVGIIALVGDRGVGDKRMGEGDVVALPGEPIRRTGLPSAALAT
jgi:hypothetical protein